jgi:type IV pilus assembly protein PilF
MSIMLKIIFIFFTMLISFSGCISQGYDQNFDQKKAAQTRVSLGLTYLKNGNFSQAKFNLDKALKFVPRSADANFAVAYYYQSVNELQQAENAYQFAMELEPKNANIANSYGAFLCQNGEFEKAVVYFLKAINTNSYLSSAQTYENLALCSRTQGLHDEAIKYLRSAINHQPERANSLFLLARALSDIGQWQEASIVLRRYEKIYQFTPQSLLLAMKIEQGIGNDNAEKGYMDLLLQIFPNESVTKSLLTDKPSPHKVLNKIVKPPVLMNAVKTDVTLVEPQVDKKTLDNKESQPRKNDPLVENNLTNVRPNGMSQTNISMAVNFIEQVNHVSSEILRLPIFHIVAQGENLYRISLLYNIKMQRLIDWNSLDDSSVIFVGKKLSLVAPSVIE